MGICRPTATFSAAQLLLTGAFKNTHEKSCNSTCCVSVSLLRSVLLRQPRTDE